MAMLDSAAFRNGAVPSMLRGRGSFPQGARMTGFPQQNSCAKSTQAWQG